MLIAKAKIAVLKMNESIECTRASNRIGLLVIATSAVCSATAIVNEK